MAVTVDGQRPPKPEPIELQLRDTDILQIPRPLVKEGLSLREFVEAGGWINTVPMGLEP